MSSVLHWHVLDNSAGCVTEDGSRPIQEVVLSNAEESHGIYTFVSELCCKMGADPDDLVEFETYAAAAKSLKAESSAARSLNAGAAMIERIDKVVQIVAAKLAQKLGQLQPFIAVFPPECAGQLASSGPA